MVSAAVTEEEEEEEEEDALSSSLMTQTVTYTSLSLVNKLTRH